ncbi:kinase-like domain-containing protein [Pisolithus marmoratus]|nr:kinase-like domain-containing protein [Pisolithus marmoratus]
MDGPLPDTAHQEQVMTLSFALDELSQRASRYGINLNGRISRTLGRNPLRGGTASVSHALPGSETELKRLFREVHTWSKLRHENIVPMSGISTEFDSTVSIISEWMPLGNAHDYVQKTENDPRPLLQDIASGLYYLHSHELGVVHGDLKGLNVLVSSNRKALLSDFGLSTVDISTFSMSVSAIRGGSYHWMAPELLDERPPSRESDVWAFGMTALELFTRAVPFPNCRSPARVLSRLIMGKLPPRPAEQSTQFRLTDGWWEICTSCWERDPASRPAVKDIIEKVRVAISQVDPTVTSLETTASTCTISKEAGSHPLPENLEDPGSDTGTGQLSDGVTLMKTALEYPASAADTSISPPGTEFFSCLVPQPSLMSDLNDKCTPPTPPTHVELNDSVNMNQSNVKEDSPSAGLLPSSRSQKLKDESQAVEEARMEDIIIAIMGPTGSGKSSFIDKVATGGTGEGVGHDLTPYTSKVKATRCTFEESSVVLVDTPGFDDARISDLDVLKMVSNWLNEEYQKGTTVSAMVYFHRITDNQMLWAPLKILRVLEKLCGKVVMPKVVLVTTMWDEVDDDGDGEERLNKLKNTCWQMMISKGSKTFEYKNTGESAMQLIRSIVHWKQETMSKGAQLPVETSDLELEATKPQRLWQRVRGSLKFLIRVQATEA